ncbi:MAG: hypothetical protein V2B19_30035 [Pseudomonadota bacterium]
MSAIILVDTSVFLNLLDVPGRNENRQSILETFREMIEVGDHFFLPMAAVIETGNHIAHLADGNQRRHYAKVFTKEVRQALAGNSPWKPTNFQKKENILSYLDDFPDHAMLGMTFADLTIVKEWEKTCARHPMSRVRIWAIDEHLCGYDRRV